MLKQENKNLQKYQELLKSFFRIVNQFTLIERKLKKYGTDELFHDILCFNNNVSAKSKNTLTP